MSSERSTKDILRDARDTLRTAQLGLALVESADPQARIPGLRNLVVFGRAVTNVLQNLRSTEPAFDSWYTPFVVEMRGDPLLRYFYDLRTEILKQGSVTTGTSVHVENFSPSRDANLWGAPPPGATSMFIGDQIGGAGWIVQRPDATEEKFYVQLPKRILDAHIDLPKAPLQHLGPTLPDKSLSTLCGAYLKYLTNVVDRADERFGSSEQGG